MLDLNLTESNNLHSANLETSLPLKNKKGKVGHSVVNINYFSFFFFFFGFKTPQLVPLRGRPRVRGKRGSPLLEFIDL